ncbi:hypothetical protein GYMLUDRAFT_160209 [Collybiopsis luxurians FD-317 M1]|nr:hypothetical protein GYMLUDRAFT_160209 [Collybiopsis luxurians FD-317 M1]
MPIVSVTEFLNTKFDYVVCGGGTSGLVVAARLSEDPNVVVGVIEAGEYHGSAPEVNLPGFSGRAFMNPQFDWTFFSSPQKACNNRPTFQPRGKGLGGSSMLNLLVLSSPSKANLNALETLGNAGWGWEDLLPYIKKSETLVPILDDNLARTYGATPDASYHGTNGPIVKSFSPWCSALHVPVLKVLDTMGTLLNPEPGNGLNVGSNTGLAAIDPKDSTRSYAASGYFAPYEARKNFLVITSATVQKVRKQDSGELKRVIGVDFIHCGQIYKVRGVRKEVILSAGTFQTPQLLELSGIGDKHHLESLGISPVIELPGVGENLQDHPHSYVIMEVDPTVESLESLADPDIMKEQMSLYKAQKGLIASMPWQTFAYVAPTTMAKEQQIKQWQAKMTDVDMSTPPSLKKQLDIIRAWMNDEREPHTELIGFPGHFFTPLSTAQPGKRYFSFVVALMHPLSRGSVHIKSTNPAEYPVIDPAYLENPVDLDMLTESVKYALKVFEKEPVKSRTVGHVMPSKEICLQGDEGIKAYIRDTTSSEFHPIGTASMLPRSEGGVVDPKLKVYGTTNLRVVRFALA